jgi:hypothetical protein
LSMINKNINKYSKHLHSRKVSTYKACDMDSR